MGKQTALDYLKSLGDTGDVKHTGGGRSFLHHLIAVQKVMEYWGADQALIDAGLLHSIYGTEGFQDFCISINKRDELKSVIGERAEFICYCNCVMDRISLDAALDQQPGERFILAREEVGGHKIPMTEQQYLDLITVHLGDWLEQVQRHAEHGDERHGWLKPGDAWGYRRVAYRKMAEQVGGSGLAMYDEVFATEPEWSRSNHQEFTLKLDKPVVPKVFIE